MNPVIITLAEGAASYVAGRIIGNAIGGDERPPSLSEIRAAIDQAVAEIKAFFVKALEAALLEQKRRELSALAEGIQRNLALYLEGKEVPNAGFAFVVDQVITDTATAKSLTQAYAPHMTGLFATFVSLRIYAIGAKYLANPDCDPVRTYAQELGQDVQWLRDEVVAHIGSLSPDIRMGKDIGCRVIENSGSFQTLGQAFCWFEQDGEALPQNYVRDVWRGNQAVIDDLRRDLGGNVMPRRRQELLKFQQETDATWGQAYREIASSWERVAATMAACGTAADIVR